ncbi:polyprenyl diphosphate synthase [Candidatus Hadarchaeum sp.]|uniref:polyprenyl diphosphate synthase n=1 Tax=Candidatus Hadarchaeum sp. TaxID=2883567 RepID=UPI00319E9825
MEVRLTFDLMEVEKIPIERLPGIAQIQKLLTKYYERKLFAEVANSEKIPKHIAIFLDGNRRFAEQMGVDRFYGHVLGAKKLEEVIGWCQELGIKHITVYAFSTENFNRDKEEVNKLMNLLAQKFKEVAKDPRVHKYKIRVKAIGNLKMLPEQVQRAIDEAQAATVGYNGHTLNIAVGYGGRAELADAVRKICERIKNGEITPKDVDEEMINNYLYTAGLPDPDLIIRTSGEERLSGFLLWQSAYSELYFCEANWPAFSKIDFLRAIRTYQSRERRFGK